MKNLELEKLTELAVHAAREAGQIINSYSQKEVEVECKDGGHTYASRVVTEVDRRAQDIILSILHPTCGQSDLALLTEEHEDDHSRFEKEYFWCIDPLDGTLPFTQKEAGYSVSIALVANNGSPKIGVVYDPVSEILWQATKGLGVKRNNQAWEMQKLKDELVFTYDRSFEKHPQRSRVLEELNAYARAHGLKQSSCDSIRRCSPECVLCLRKCSLLSLQICQTRGGWGQHLGLCRNCLSFSGGRGGGE